MRNYFSLRLSIMTKMIYGATNWAQKTQILYVFIIKISMASKITAIEIHDTMVLRRVSRKKLTYVAFLKQI